MRRLRDWITDDVRRVALLLVVCVTAAVLVVDYSRVPHEDLQVGDVASRTVEAPFTFRYQDFGERERREAEAREAAPWVFVYRADLVGHLQGRIAAAYETGRRVTLDIVESQELEGPSELRDPPPEIVAAFRDTLGVHVPERVITPLVRAGFPPEAQRLSSDLLGRALDGPILANREQLPPTGHPLLVITADGAERTETTVRDREAIGTPATARERLHSFRRPGA